jgi:hypothetical protein
MALTVSGWKLLRDGERERLLDLFPPKYERTVADHVTLSAGAPENSPPPPDVDARIVGHADDGKSLECMVVQINGSTDRPDGSTYHITWSLGLGRKAKESNDVLRDDGWRRLDKAIPIRLQPAIFDW